MTHTIIEGGYLKDLLAQPAALDRTVERLEAETPLRELAGRLRDGAFRRIVLTGMGSSLYALYPLHLQLVARGWTSLWVETAELVYYQSRLLDAETLVVAVSQSGRSAETVRLLELNAGRAPVIGVTNTAGSPLALRSAAVMLTHAGEESTVSCKTYVASLATLHALGVVLQCDDVEAARRELGGAGAAVADYLAAWRAHAAECADLARGARCLFLAGRGASLAAALTGGLITKESTHFPTEGMSTAAFRHGPMEMLGPETLVVILGGAPPTRTLNAGIVEEIRALGHRAELVGEGARYRALRLPAVSEAVRPIVEILPVEMLTLGLASLFGREAGKFTLATKVTATE
ncbi:MAG: SIS domain-containing protein [Acidobacteria bacterium]|nr:SIS domain-containing protein [Acidobacteriota bacterium]